MKNVTINGIEIEIEKMPDDYIYPGNYNQYDVNCKPIATSYCGEFDTYKAQKAEEYIYINLNDYRNTYRVKKSNLIFAALNKLMDNL